MHHISAFSHIALTFEARVRVMMHIRNFIYYNSLVIEDWGRGWENSFPLMEDMENDLLLGCVVVFDGGGLLCVRGGLCFGAWGYRVGWISSMGRGGRWLEELLV